MNFLSNPGIPEPRFDITLVGDNQHGDGNFFSATAYGRSTYNLEGYYPTFSFATK
jgi:hypothetical protein